MDYRSLGLSMSSNKDIINVIILPYPKSDHNDNSKINFIILPYPMSNHNDNSNIIIIYPMSDHNDNSNIIIIILQYPISTLSYNVIMEITFKGYSLRLNEILI